MEESGLQARFRAMADSVPVLIWTTGADGRCTYVNHRWLEFTGHELDLELGDGWTRSIHPEDLDRTVAGWRAAVAEGQPFVFEFRLRRADGAWRWILGRGVPLPEPGGEVGRFIGSGIDLTERREADEALQESREQLAAAMAAAHMGTFTLDVATNHVVRDHNLEALYGLAPGAAATMEDWARLVHPDDRAVVLAEVDRVLAEGGEYHLEHRIVRPDRQVRWVERRGHGYRGADGGVAGIRGIVIDITERKVAELERSVLFERVTRLQEVTAALAGAGTPDEVLELIVGRGVRAVGASAGAVAVLDADGCALEVARTDGYAATVVDAFPRIDLAAAAPLSDAARTVTPVACTDLGDWTARYPHLASHPAGGGHQAAAALPMVVDDRVIGAVGLSFDAPQGFDVAQMEFLSAVVAQCAQALDRAWSYTAEAAARRAAEEAQARLALLADASAILAGSMEYEATLPEVARLAVPLLGDCCVIDVFDADGADCGDAGGGRRWRRVATVDVDPTVEDRLRSIPPQAWVATGDDPETNAATRVELGLHATYVVSMEARGRRLGMLAVGRRRGGEDFTDADRSLADGLGTRLAQAIDNAGLYRAERAAHEEAETAAVRLHFLLDVSTTLASPLSLDDRLRRLADQTVAAVADVCLIDLVHRDGSIRRVAVAGADAASQQAAETLRDLMQSDPHSRHPSAAAVRTGATQLCEDVTEERLRAITTGPAHLEAARRLDALSYVSVPLPGTPRPLGAITLITTAPSGRRYGPADVALVEDMATRVALGLQSAAMHEEMRRVAQTLQASLLPSVPPRIPGLEVGTRYVAAGEGTVVGGDFFDVFAVGPDSWAVVVGDVCGQGVEAATVTGLARHTVRSAALEHESPAAVLSHLNDVLLGVTSDALTEADPRFCTVCLGRIRLTGTGAVVTLALGGHPRPFVLGADGAVRQVGRPGSLVGIVPRAAVHDDEHQIAAGESLILYTDGITERHVGRTFFGEQGVAEVLAGAAGLTADEIAGRLEQAARTFVEGRPADDMAVVVVRVPPR